MEATASTRILGPYCGDGSVDPGEQCDDGNGVENDGCSSSCIACGNGVITAPETCDDGNLIDGDGCTAACRIECASSPGGACEADFGKGKLLIKETPGREKMLVQWKKGPGLSGTDFGNPLDAGGRATLYVSTTIPTRWLPHT